MRDAILTRLVALGAEARLARAAKLERQLRELERELAEVRQLIPAWSRVFFFVESADERREKELKAQIASARADLDRTRGELRADLEAVATELPPFGVAILLEEALEAAEPFSTHDPVLPVVLERLARRIVTVWAPDFDEARVLATLESASACRAAAESAPTGAADSALVHAPASPEALLPILARRLLEGRYFSLQEREGELTSKRNRLVEEHEQAAASVTILDKINPFSTSPRERRRNELADDLRRTRDELRVARAEARRLLEDCVRGYPPLALHRQTLEALAAATRPSREKELALGSGGRVLELEVDRSRVLVAASLKRVEKLFRATFPGVPLPRELRGDLGGKAERVPLPLEPLVRAFAGELSRSSAPARLEEALEHARAASATRRTREAVEKKITLASRLAFWSESEEKDERDALLEREKWHEEQEKLARTRLVGAAREAANVLAPFRLRDATLEALHDLERVSTNPGQHVSHLLPAVFGIEAALRSLRGLRLVLESGWDLSGDEGELLDLAASSQPEDVKVAAHERLVWKPLPKDKLARLLAFRLERTGFHETYRRIREIGEHERAVASEKDEVASRLSIWDHLNVFSKSPDKLRDKKLARMLTRLGTELEAAVERLRAHLDHALHVYPPAQLYYSLPSVERAILEIHAVCKPIWITVTHREWVPDDDRVGPFSHKAVANDGGPLTIEVASPRGRGRWVERERQELRYICVLVGKEEAQYALSQWAARVVGSFGELPGFNELLETWAGQEAGPV
ncbi:MAG TPA: hypothetical protein VFF73_41600 [Planctomycetota bacterium]|nr:hypothetical protein [Planctomycetota bacterium]